MNTHTDKEKKDNKKYWRLKFELFKTRSKMFCIVCAPIIITALEIFLEGYKAFRSNNRGGG